MEEEQALEFLKSKGYTCMGTPRPPTLVCLPEK